MIYFLLKKYREYSDNTEMERVLSKSLFHFRETDEHADRCYEKVRRSIYVHFLSFQRE